MFLKLYLHSLINLLMFSIITLPPQPPTHLKIQRKLFNSIMSNSK